MIPQGLKVGDTFKDGGFTYKVLKVLDNGMYESTMVAEEKALQFSEVKEEVKEDFGSMQYAALKKLCAERGLDAKGSKNELIARLEG